MSPAHVLILAGVELPTHVLLLAGVEPPAHVALGRAFGRRAEAAGIHIVGLLAAGGVAIPTSGTPYIGALDRQPKNNGGLRKITRSGVRVRPFLTRPATERGPRRQTAAVARKG